ncbi:MULTISPECIES: DMT family transporter [unclassified Agarivorans]|uniref:DMT family transporter n=1 Tax=unclassified Agarivorans TaxID=2636026 RepID=UPI0026E43FF1|nr:MULTISPECIES: DMT family transporter [unclassified Agarivorans]MDO6686576.1 DMT family transporter [Agarivorans sp. 3_MG-2023]MDO6715394.1 DMT family transporter [Agarivorans sp. 2_MG-2023]
MKTQTKAYAFGISAVLMWSTVATAFKLALQWLTPIQLVLLASISSILLLTGVLLWQRKLPLAWVYAKQRPGFFLLVGAINPFLYYLVLFKAYDLLPAQQAQSLNYTWAITLALLAVPFLKQQLRKQDVIAMALGYLGVLVIATRGDILAMQFDSVPGVLLALFSTLLWAGYWIINTRNSGDPVASLLVAFCFSLPMVLLYCWWSDGLPTWNAKAWLGAVYVGLFEMGIAFVCWVLALKFTHNTARISNLIFISPFLSLFFIAYFLGEQIEPATYIGLLLIISGLLIQQWRGKTKPLNADK